MRPPRRLLRVLALACCLLPPPLLAQRVALGARAGTTVLSLGSDSVPAVVGGGASALWEALVWEEVRPGLSWAEIELAAGALRIPIRAIVVRLDPGRFDLRLELATGPDRMRGAWTVDSAAAGAALAMNAGQFRETGPWGWVVLDGRERRDPGRGPLSVGLAVTDEGTLRWVPPEALERARGERGIRWAFQSYPVLVRDGRVPDLARDPTRVDLDHRDARLLLAERADGTLLVVLTRFDVLGPAAERVPVGLTLPESLAFAGALGAKHAVMLDGGASAQLLLRGPGGTRIWRGSRRVPLGLVAVPRPD